MFDVHWKPNKHVILTEKRLLNAVVCWPVYSSRRMVLSTFERLDLELDAASRGPMQALGYYQ